MAEVILKFVSSLVTRIPAIDLPRALGYNKGQIAWNLLVSIGTIL